MSDVHVAKPNRRRIRGLSEMVNELCSATGKQRYIDRRGAVRAMSELVADDPNAALLNTFRCTACGDFHVGHLPEAAH
jgi:hypothetical protein